MSICWAKSIVYAINSCYYLNLLSRNITLIVFTYAYYIISCALLCFINGWPYPYRSRVHHYHWGNHIIGVSEASLKYIGKQISWIHHTLTQDIKIKPNTFVCTLCRACCINPFEKTLICTSSVRPVVWFPNSACELCWTIVIVVIYFMQFYTKPVFIGLIRVNNYIPLICTGRGFWFECLCLRKSDGIKSIY